MQRSGEGSVAGRGKRTAAPLRRRSRWGIAIGVAAGILMMLPALVAIFELTGKSWFPVDDFAITDMRVRDVLSSHTPLTGLYSRPGWNHPGPMMFWLMAPLSKLSGDAPWATRVGGAVIQAGALGWLAWITWRQGLRTLLTAAAVVGLTFVALTPLVFRMPWNPYIPLPVFVLFLFLCLVTMERFVQLVAMVVVGSFLVQTHISYTLMVVGGFVWVGACVVYRARRNKVVPVNWKRSLGIAGGVFALLWMPTVIDAITNSGGNLEKILDYFTGEHRSVGLSRALGLVAAEFRFPPPWLGGSSPEHILTGDALPVSRAWLLVPFVLLVAAGVTAGWRRSGPDARAVGLATVVLVAGTVAVGNADQALTYTFGWRVVIAVFAVVVSVRALVGGLLQSSEAWPRLAFGGLALAILAFGAIELGRDVANDRSYRGLEARGPALVEVLSDLRQGWMGRGGTVLVREEDSTLPSLYDGVVNALDRDGVDVRVDPSWGRVFGETRVGNRQQSDEVWVVTQEGWRIPELQARGGRVLARTTPLPPNEESQIARLQQRIGSQLAQADRKDLVSYLESPLAPFALADVAGVDQPSARLLGLLNKRVQASAINCRCAIVSFPAQTG